MDILGRSASPFSGEFWERLDLLVDETLKKHLVARKVIPLCQPMLANRDVAIVDSVERQEKEESGFVATTGREILMLPQLYEDFYLFWRDIAAFGEPQLGDLSAAVYAAQKMASREDTFVFYGNDRLGYSGLTNEKGINNQKLSDWSKGENAYANIAEAINTLDKNGFRGEQSLFVSADLYRDLHRIQPGTGVLEVERVSSLLSGKLLKSDVLKPKAAVLVCAEEPFIDLQLGQDLVTAYLESASLNHKFRILETILLRVKEPKAIVFLS